MEMIWFYLIVLPIVSASDINLQLDQEGLEPESRVFNGTPIFIYEAPYYVRVASSWVAKPDGSCGAAHCVYDAAAAKYATVLTVYLGKTHFYSNDPSQLVQIAITAIKHPAYNTPLFPNDIALVRLPKCILYTGNMAPIPLTSVDPSQLTGKPKYIVTGFGETAKRYLSQPAGASPQVLQQAEITFVSRQTCQNLHTQANANLATLYPQGYSTALMISLAQIPATSICGSSYPQATCTGDSGGPFMCEYPKKKWELCGISSFGVGCGLGVPSVYTDVWQFKNWIQTESKKGAGLLKCPDGWNLPAKPTKKPRTRRLPDSDPEAWSSFSESSSPKCECTCHG